MRLPIPEKIVSSQDHANYTVPSGYYGFLQMSVAATGAGSIDGDQGGTVTSSAEANSAKQWIPTGSVIAVSTSNPQGVSRPRRLGSTATVNYSSVSRVTTARASILINGSEACTVLASASSDSNSFSRSSSVPINTVGARTSHSVNTAWTLSLFPIPKANLPEGLRE